MCLRPSEGSVSLSMNWKFRETNVVKVSSQARGNGGKQWTMVVKILWRMMIHRNVEKDNSNCEIE